VTGHPLFERGWHRFDADPALAEWTRLTLPAARAAVRNPANAQWLRCGGTWFAGVNVLPNDDTGAVAGGIALAGDAVDFLHAMVAHATIAWEPGQVSVCYPGYPRPMPSETEAAFRYRHDRDAAHVDGLLPVGPARRRFLREHHIFLLGIPIIEVGAEASPLVVWEGSHRIMAEAFRATLRAYPPLQWADIDLTGVYHAARRRSFEACPRVTVTAKPGEAYVVHRLALHGVAPWQGDVQTEDGRMIIYFRPQYENPEAWLDAP
jgi:hypothetical protein